MVTLPALGLVSKGTEGTRLQAQVLPLLAPAHQYESEHSMWVSSILNVAKPGRGHVLGEVGMVSGTQEKGKMCSPSPARSLPISATRGKRQSCRSQAAQGTHPNPHQKRSSHHCK